MIVNIEGVDSVDTPITAGLKIYTIPSFSITISAENSRQKQFVHTSNMLYEHVNKVTFTFRKLREHIASKILKNGFDNWFF